MTQKPETGVLLVNLGTPEGTDYWNMRRYLEEFLSDKRVIELPRTIWFPILYGIILTVRPKKSGAKYARIWNYKDAESPLRTYTRSQGVKLQQRLKGENVRVDWAMRYGRPSIKDVANQMIDEGCQRILLFPLYPQYAAATTATVCDAFFDCLKHKRIVPAIRTVPPYCDDPLYIRAIAQSIKNHIKKLDFKPERILASFHGLPKRYDTAGDPYYQQCLRTTTALRDFMGLDERQLMMTFQSRFGREEWLQPYTQETAESLAENGVKSIIICNPGFVSDCLETLDEIGREVGESFIEKGGLDFSHVPCLNDGEDGMMIIETMVRRELQGWI